MNMNKNYILICSLFLSSCAAPALKYYSLSLPQDSNSIPQTIKFTGNSKTIYIYPVNLPDYLNTSDIITRQETLITSSPSSRLTSVLSKEIRNFLTNTLRASFPDILITDQNPMDKVSYQIIININQFDVEKLSNKQGKLTCKAQWYIVPQNKSIPIQKYQVTLIEENNLLSDQDIIYLEQKTLKTLSQKIAQSLNLILY